MQGIIHHSGRWRLALIVVAGGLTAACSTYHPLDRGSKVPWAKAGAVPEATLAAASAERTDAAPPTASLPTNRYVVQTGDRLASLATSYGISVRALAEANQLEAPYVLNVGQVLRIPEDGQPAEPEDQQVADERPEVKPVAVAPAPTAGGRYVVRRGETLWAISRRIDVPMIQLAAANQIASPYDVNAGQRLRIPGPDNRPAETAAPKKVVMLQHGTGAPPLSGQGFLWPVNGKVIGEFGRTRQGQRRDGIDIAAREGAPVLAAEDGIVAYADDGVHGYGRLILLRHGDGYITTYAHNAALLVEAGDLVERGQVIARVGATGDVTRSLLHFELRKGRKPIDPESVLVHEPTAVASTE
jgi:murein DD-endopeptidase MepM/ murein hydrolase activator NlpD